MARAKTYVAVIGDIVNSRQVPDRARLQTIARRVLARVNRQYRAHVASRFIMTVGDEFQGLLSGTAELDQLLACIRAELNPVEVRFGIGIGNLETKLLPSAIGMDGPCFHRARSALQRAAKEGMPVDVKAASREPAFEIYGWMFDALRDRWTERQRLVMDLVMSGMRGIEVAEKIDVRPSAISQHFEAARGYQVLMATSSWTEALDDAFRKTENG